MSSASEIHWKWTPCLYSLLSDSHSTSIFKQEKNEENNLSPFNGIDFTMSKSLMFYEEVGWNWHKSWNVPTITATIKKNSQIDDLKAYHAGLYLIKRTNNSLEEMTSLDLKGDTEIKLNKKNEEKITFSSIKIMTTSFSHNGEKFYFLLNIYHYEENVKKTVLSYMSSPFFVDSREAARKNSSSQYKQIAPFIDPFLPGFLLKDFIKRKNRSIKDKGKIENSLEGLYHYLSAPNIRFKVKHPLFLLIKFSEVFSLYFKKGAFHDQESFILNFQNNILSNYANTIKKDETNHKIKKNDFILLFKETESIDKVKKQKINGLIHVIGNYLLPICNSDSNIPHSYEFFSNIHELKNSYKKLYPMLNSQKNSSLVHISKNNNKKKDRLERVTCLDIQDVYHLNASSQLEEPCRKKIKMEESTDSLICNGKIPIIREINNYPHSISPVQIISSKIFNKNQKKQKEIKKEMKSIEIEKEPSPEIKNISNEIHEKHDKYLKIERFIDFYSHYINSMMIYPYGMSPLHGNYLFNPFSIINDKYLQ